MDVFSMMGIGAACGLKTVDEAYLQVFRHYDLLFSMDTAADELDALWLDKEKFKEIYGSEIPRYFHKVEINIQELHFELEKFKYNLDETLEDLKYEWNT